MQAARHRRSSRCLRSATAAHRSTTMERSVEFRCLLKLFGATDIPSEVRVVRLGLIDLLTARHLDRPIIHGQPRMRARRSPSPSPCTITIIPDKPDRQEDQDLLLQASAIPSEDDAGGMERQHAMMPEPASDFAVAAAAVAKGFQGTLR